MCRGSVAVAELTEALGTLASAQEELATKLEGLELDTNADGEIDVEAGDAGIAEVNASLTAFTGVVDDQLDAISDDIADGAFDAAGDNTKAGLIADGRSAGAEAIEDAEEAVATAEGNLADGVLSALSSVESRVSELEAATDAANAADTAEDGELAKYNTLNDGDVAVANGDTLELTDTADGGSATIELANLVDGEWVVNESADFTDANITASGFDDLSGFEDYLASLQAETDAAAAQTSAETALDNAIIEVLQLENDDDTISTVDTGIVASAQVEGETEVTVDLTAGTGDTAPNAQSVLDARDTLETEQQELDDLNEAIADYEASAELAGEVEDLDDAVTEAREAIENSEEDGGLGVTLLEADNSFTAEDDVYLFSAEDSAGETLTGFGSAGEDKIFIGDSFSRVDLADDAVFTEEQGDAATLEVFFQQSGNDAVLSFEDKAFAGNASTDADLSQVTLAGVSVDDLSIENGYINIA